MGQTTRLSAIILTCFLLLSGGCASVPTGAPESDLPRHNRIVAIGDVHGSYSGLVSIMREAALIDTSNRWIGGNTLLVQTGDFLDRGADVRQVLDLLMSLQPQAKAAGGEVVVLMGNHEALNIFGSRLYVVPKAYASFAGPGSEEKQIRAFERWQALFNASDDPEGEDPETRAQNWLAEHPPGFVEYTEAMGPESRYGKWIRDLPILFRYGGTFFIHAGISPEYADMPQTVITQRIAADIRTFDKNKSYLMKLGFVEQWYTMSEMMAVVDSILAFAETEELSDSLRAALPRLKEIKSFFDGIYETSPLMVDEGPVWFRGFAEWPDEQFASYLQSWLKENDAWRMVVGHTPMADGRIRSRLDGSVFLTDTGMLSGYFEGGRASALEIRNDEVTAIYEAGERTPFPPPEIDYGPDHVWTDAEGVPLPFENPEEIETFLRTAEPVSSEKILSGVNRPKKVLLQKEGYKLNAIFRYQSDTERPRDMTSTRYFLDSYTSELAAYELNRLLGLKNIPPTVLRALKQRQGTIQLWAEQTILDRQRADKKMLIPETLPWNQQMWDMRVFDNLIDNADRNQGNILIDSNWRLILIDHTRSFARNKTLPNPKLVVHCSRGLWYAIRHLDEAKVRDRLAGCLYPAEIDAIFARRQALVQLIRGLIDRNGEENVLF